MLVRGSIFFVLFIASVSVRAQLNATSRPDIYPYLVERFQAMSVTGDDIVFIGNSITFWGDWRELTGSDRVKNWGIPGDHTYGILARVDDIVSVKPSKVFILAGINDLAGGLTDSLIVAHLKEIVGRILEGTPETAIYIQSILPTNPTFGKLNRHYGHEDRIQQINRLLSEFAENTRNCTFIDLYTYFLDDAGFLLKEYTWDGVHLTVAGYELWKEILIQKGYLSSSDLEKTGIDTNMKNKAIADLKSLLYAQEKWIKVHVAEFLIWEDQLITEVRNEFLDEHDRFGDIPQYRIGIWRVLAQAAPNAEERESWIGKIVEVYHNTHSPDRLHAIETLAKLRYPVMEVSFLDEIENDAIDPYSLYQLWNLSYHPGVKKETIIHRLLGYMEQNTGNEQKRINMQVASYILRSFPGLPTEYWNRLSAIGEKNENNAGLHASILSTLWITLPNSVPSEAVEQLRSKMSLSAEESTGVNHVMMALAKRSSITDREEIESIFERLRDQQSVGYDADLHASAAYVALSYSNSKLK